MSNGNINAKQIKGILEVENGGTGNPTYSNNQILTYGTQSFLSSGYTFNDSGTSSNDIWSASKVLTAIDAGGSPPGIVIKSGTVNGASFSGNPKKATITFVTAFDNNNYSITVTGESSRTWTIETKSASSFVINANANSAFTNDVFWQAIKNGEINF